MPGPDLFKLAASIGELFGDSGPGNVVANCRPGFPSGVGGFLTGAWNDITGVVQGVANLVEGAAHLADDDMEDVFKSATDARTADLMNTAKAGGTSLKNDLGSTPPNAQPVGLRETSTTAASRPTEASSQPKVEAPSRAQQEAQELDAYENMMISVEGYRKTVYPDSLGIPTVGIGHKVVPSDNLKLGDQITDFTSAGLL